MKTKDAIPELAKELVNELLDKADLEMPTWEPFQKLETPQQKAALCLIMASMSVLKKHVKPLGALALTFEHCDKSRHFIVADLVDDSKFLEKRLNVHEY